VWSENVRSYTSRSFDKPIWNNVLGNKKMQYAIAIAQFALYAAVLIPYFSDMILGLRGAAVGLYGWALALVGPVGCLALCEAAKKLTAWQKGQYQQQLALRQQADAQSLNRPAVVRQPSTRVAKAKSVHKMMPAEPVKPVVSKKAATSTRRGLCRCFGMM